MSEDEFIKRRVNFLDQQTGESLTVMISARVSQCLFDFNLIINNKLIKILMSIHMN